MLESLDEHLLPMQNEAEVLRLLADGLTDAEIAERLHLSIPAVRSRLHGFYDRSGIHGRAAVARAKGHLGCCLAAPPNAA